MANASKNTGADAKKQTAVKTFLPPSLSVKAPSNIRPKAPTITGTEIKIDTFIGDKSNIVEYFVARGPSKDHAQKLTVKIIVANISAWFLPFWIVGFLFFILLKES